MAGSLTKQTVQCFHCGEDCEPGAISSSDKDFCCQGCRMVYEILNESGLCDYYKLSRNPGINARQAVRQDKFAFLDEEKISAQLTSFRDDKVTHVTFYLPQIHCSSCLWLLENLHRLEPGIVSCRVNFERKEADLVFDHRETSMRKVAELMSSVGYEPYISFRNLGKPSATVSKSKVYKLGVAGFCFANIMLLSFPEYLGINASEGNLRSAFRLLSLLLSLPVFFYSASEFYLSAWKGLRHRFLNIDTPIVLSVVITFSRSLYEIISGTGGGYLDSMSGIVFFMLLGRVLQDRTYGALSFERDYTSYFPVAVTRIGKESRESIVTLDDIKLNDTLLIHNQEIIPADCILTKGTAIIDYSFVNGESFPVKKEMGEIVYAGGRHISSNIELLVIKEVAQSYLTRLWNRQELLRDQKKEKVSFVHLVSRYFTWLVLGVAFSAAIYWWQHNPAKMWNAVTSVLIIACPCGLLLSNLFANGNILRRLSRNGFYLRNAQVIENIAAADCIAFDKTGTLTTGRFDNISYEGRRLSTREREQIATLAAQSTHPLCKSIAAWAGTQKPVKVKAFKELPGEGIEGIVDEDLVSMGSAHYITGRAEAQENSSVYVSIEEKPVGKFVFRNQYREGIGDLVRRLRKDFRLSVISGDNAGEKNTLEQMFGAGTILHFNQGPSDKLEAIRNMQRNHVVMMIGDGLNDAGALRLADIGISVAEDNNHFTPASDAILSAASLPKLRQFIALCRYNRKVVLTAFIVSALYNTIGLFFAVQGGLQPVIAAILMPCSSISILIITFGLGNFRARTLGI